VRAQGIEASAEVLGPSAANIIREGFGTSTRRAVRGLHGNRRLRDRAVPGPVRGLTADPDPNVRIGSYYALERMGNGGYRRAGRS